MKNLRGLVVQIIPIPQTGVAFQLTAIFHVALILATLLLWDTVIGPGMRTCNSGWANQKTSMGFLSLGTGISVGRHEPK